MNVCRYLALTPFHSFATSGCGGPWVEASWVAIGCSPYFGALYKQHRARGKKANTAVLIVARRMCRIIWQLLEQKRDFEKRAPRPKLYSFPGCSALALTVNPALAS